ncbi:protein mono-ADP-ribosyltransferase PARP16 isoform X2 [Microcaecilia unicolor]|uniref:Poly [ADP-ribose] polymerase n=1 Tax=Microcaecilia unicolor TaxID=1415580 RepID=A0A6P7WZG9_9AMPH|nr:protein mono-ADP-ribosyltransferase PARP16 isoform X2 [Microcaecilia unicolor]
MALAGSDLLALDLKWSLFVSALQSYKRDSMLRPFPPLYAQGEHKDFDALGADTNALPNLKAFLDSGYQPDERAWNLLMWVLSSKSITVKSANKNETSLFGEGTYLTSDLSLALLYSPYGQGWQHSLLGSRLSCVAVCEIIDHPDVKCQVKKKGSEEQDRKRARVRNSEGGDVPHKYFVVTNNQLVRLKYFLLYSQKQNRQRSCSRPSWISSHRFAVLMVLYLLLLVIISFSNSPAFLYYWKKAFEWKR